MEWSDIVRNHYDRRANTYDYKTLKSNSARLYIEDRRRESILSMITKKGVLLDVACGTGYYLALFSWNECLGMDISKKMIEKCKEKGLKNVLVANYEELPFRNDKFDIVLCINAFHYTKEPQKALNEISRVLKGDGIFVLTYFNLLNPRSVVHFIRDILKIKNNIENRYTLKGLKKMLAKADLEIVEYVGVNFLPFASNSKKRSKKALYAFKSFERKVNKTFLNYFCDEVTVKLKKQS